MPEQKSETLQKTFANRAEAWEFMWQCDKDGIPVGFPHPVKGTEYWAVKYFKKK